MSRLLFHSRQTKTALLLGALVLATLMFGRAERTRAAIPPCYPNNCPDLTIGYDNLRPTADGFTVDVYVGAVNGYDVYACLGNSTQCVGSQYADPTMWKDISRGICESSPCNVAYTGLRSNRTYQNVFIEAVNGAQYDNVNVGPVTTWPNYQAAPTITNVTDVQATVNWNTAFPGDSDVFYGLNPPDWELESSPPSASTVTAVTAVSSGKAWAVSFRGSIAGRSTAGTWSLENSNTSQDLYDIDAYNDSLVWAAGQNGTIIRSTNGGASWSTPMTSGTASNIQAIYAPTATTAWAVTEAGEILFFNGGSWQKKYTLPGNPILLDVVSIDSKTVWVVGQNGTIARSSDGGTTWTSSTPTGAFLESISTLDGVNLWAGGSSGTLLFSSNGGASWTSVATGSIATLSDIRQVTPNEFWFSNKTSVGHYDASATPRFTYFTEPNALTVGSIDALEVISGSDILAAGQNFLFPVYSLCHPAPGSCAADQFSPGSVTAHSLTLTGLTSGAKYYLAAHSAGAGVASGVFATLTTTAPDTEPPTIAFSDPATTTFITRTSPYPVKGVASDNIGVQSVSLSSDRTGGQTVTGTTSWSASVPLQAGNNVLTATARDSVNQASATTTIVFDNQAPTVTINAPTAGSTVNATPTTISGSASDVSSGNTNIVSLEFTVNGGPRQTIIVPTPGPNVSWSAQAGPLTIGNNNNAVVVYAQDEAGNEGSASVTFGYQEPTFTITPSNTPQTRNAGDVVTYPLTLTSQNGFTGNVDLTASGLPAGSTVSFSPTPVVLAANGTANSTMTIATNTATTGTFTITITGTSGPKTATATVQLTLNPAPDFTLSASPGAQNVVAGNGTSYQITAAANSTFNGTVTFQPVTGLPSGAAGTYSAPSLSLTANQSKSLTLNITTQPSTPDGSYTLTVTGTSGTLTRLVTVNLNIAPPPDLTLSVLPALQSVTAGGAPTSFNGTATAINGFNETTTLSVAKTPDDPNITVTLSLTQITTQMWTANASQQFVINVSTTSAVSGGDYRLDVKAVSATMNKVVPVTLRVGADTTPPVITNVMATPNYNSVRITWQTNEPANSAVVIYSDQAQTTVVGTVSDNSYCTDSCHNLYYGPPAGSLNPLTTYYFSVTSVDQAPTPPASGLCFPAGNCTTVFKQTDNVTPLQFTTLDAPDTEPPTVALSQPADGSEVVGTVTISGSATDNKSVAQVTLTIVRTADNVTVRNSILACSGGSCTFSYSWDTIASTVNGQHVISVRAQDAAGNLSPTVSRTVTVNNDLTRPIVLSGPTAENLFCDDVTNLCQITIHWQTDDASTSEVEYGLTSSYGAPGSPTRYDDTDPPNSAPVYQDHHVTLRRLERNQLYHYKITSCNISGFCTN